MLSVSCTEAEPAEIGKQMLENLGMFVYSITYTDVCSLFQQLLGEAKRDNKPEYVIIILFATYSRRQIEVHVCKVCSCSLCIRENCSNA